MARAGPPGRSSVRSPGGGRGAVFGRRENRPDGGKIPILPLVVLRIGFPLETEKKRKNGARSSRNRGLLPPIVSRIGFPCKQRNKQRNKWADFPETRDSSRRSFRESAYLQAMDRATETPPEIFPKPGLLPSPSFRELALPD